LRLVETTEDAHLRDSRIVALRDDKKAKPDEPEGVLTMCPSSRRRRESMRSIRFIVAIAAISHLTLGQDMPAIAGTWRGQSSCEQKESACREETVVYRFSPLQDKRGSFSVSADKIVDGKSVYMGTLEFRYVEVEHALVCDYAQGIWRLLVDGEKMEGTLTRRNGSVFRRLALQKE
jgi:hypothetical protein